MGIACLAGPAAKHHADQAHAVALDRCHEVESRSVDIASLDAVGTGVI